MAKGISLVSVIAWLVGIIVSLAVGFGLVFQVLFIPKIPVVITQIAGWIVVIGAVISVIIAIFNR